MRRVVLLLTLVSSSAGAVVIRDDVQDLQYRVSASEFPALADVSGEGHGVLIAAQWVLTAAHAVTWQHEFKVIVVNGTPRAVDKLVIHPGYKKLPQEIIDAAMKSGDARAAMAVISTSDDVALIKLTTPVTDVQPVAIYRAPKVGQVVRIMGKGATATGKVGHDPHGPNRTDLRHAFNTLSQAGGRWLAYVFDRPPSSLPLEGMAGNGDSGGPLLVEVAGQWQVAGLTSWKYVDGNPATFRPGLYGQTSYGVRLAHYVEWIEATITAEANRALAIPVTPGG